jgi:RNA polymerase sigma factor (sigma-70 family)
MNSTELPSESDDLASGSITRWIDLFRVGNADAAEQIWNRYFSSIVSVARAKLGLIPSCTLDPEDIALSAFHALYRAASANRLPEIQDRNGLWQSLILITAGKVIDAKRREFSQKRGGTTTERTPIHLLELMEKDEQDPALAAMFSEQFELLLNQLEDRELQEIAILKLEGFTNDEIARRLDCGERTVKRRLAVIRRIWEENGVAPAN